MIERTNPDLNMRSVLYLFGIGWFVPYLLYTLWAHGLLPVDVGHRNFVAAGWLDTWWARGAEFSIWITLFIQLVFGCTFVLGIRELSWSMLGFRGTTWGWFALALGGLIVSYVFSGALQVIYQLPDVETGVEAIDNNGRQIQSAAYSLGYLLSLLVLVGPATAIIEEVAFRSVLYGWLRSKFGPFVGIAISSLIFGIVHLRFVNPGGMVGMGATLQVILGGVVLALLYEKSGSLWPSIYMHGVNNVIGILQVFTPR